MTKITQGLADCLRTAHRLGAPVSRLADTWDLTESHTYRVLNGHHWTQEVPT